VSARQPIWFGSEEERRKLTGRCGAFAALWWAILEISFEIFFGPHVRLARSMAVGAGFGAAAGLIMSALQWSVLRGYVRSVGRLVPATVAGSTISGLICGSLLYFLNSSLDLYRWAPALQGAIGAAFAGLATAYAQWLVLRDWAAPGRDRRDWMAAAATGSVLGATSACVAAIMAPIVLNFFLESEWWPFIIIATYLAAGIAGGLSYGRFIDRGFRRVLPSTAVPTYAGVGEALDVTQAPERAMP
jgi:cation transporter-like permease